MTPEERQQQEHEQQEWESRLQALKVALREVRAAKVADQYADFIFDLAEIHVEHLFNQSRGGK